MSLYDSSEKTPPANANPARGRDVYRAAETHPGCAALETFLANLGREELPTEKLAIFFASMTAFVRHITPGIPALAARLTDELEPLVPMQAHAIGAHILDASIDEYGLSGTKPHVVLLRDFARYFGLSDAEIDAPENAVPSSRTLGQKMFEWYRVSPVDYALGMHTASEATGYLEAHGFHTAFTQPPKYGLTRDTPEFAYVMTHVENEGDHSTDVVRCLDQVLELRPNSTDAIFQGCRDYMDLYRAMFEEMDVVMFG